MKLFSLRAMSLFHFRFWLCRIVVSRRRYDEKLARIFVKIGWCFRIIFCWQMYIAWLDDNLRRLSILDCICCAFYYPFIVNIRLYTCKIRITACTNFFSGVPPKRLKIRPRRTIYEQKVVKLDADLTIFCLANFSSVTSLLAFCGYTWRNLVNLFFISHVYKLESIINRQ